MTSPSSSASLRVSSLANCMANGLGGLQATFDKSFHNITVRRGSIQPRAGDAATVHRNAPWGIGYSH